MTAPHVAPAATTVTRSVSCPGLDFTAIDDQNQTVFSYIGVRLVVFAGHDSWVVCDPGLPTGAVVSRVGCSGRT